MSALSQGLDLYGVIFDLDGVLTDTAEYHYQGWQRLADEEGLPFDRKVNEQLRGVSRRRSLEIILGGRQVSPERFEEMMERKNRYYQELLEGMSPNDILPGALNLLHELRAANIKVAIASASKNARTVIERLNLTNLADALADGYSVERTKPAPDLFLYAAQELGIPPAQCVVVEDATAGIDAALLAGMWAVGLGPIERVGHAHAVFPGLDGVHWADFLAALNTTQFVNRTENGEWKMENGKERPPFSVFDSPFSIDTTWMVTEDHFDPARLHHKETVFTIGNGYLSTRGAFEEGYPDEWRTTMIHGVFDDVVLAFTELANAPDWLHFELLIEGARFRLDRGQVLRYRRVLNLRNGLLTRAVRWRSPRGQTVDLVFERFCSLSDPHLMVLRCQVTLLDAPGTVELRAGLRGCTDNRRVAHWDTIEQGAHDHFIYLHSRTRHSGIELGAAAHLSVDGAAEMEREVWDTWGQPTCVVRRRLDAGQPLTATKCVTVYTSREVGDPTPKAAATLAKTKGDFESLLQTSASEWNKYWATANVVIEGDEQAQQAVRYNLYQLLIAAPQQDDDVSIAAKTLSGFGYRGHVFWDTEIFILPMFTCAMPHVARNLLRYRYRRLPGARRKAAANGCEGAQFPWESADTGEEVTPPWLPDARDPARLVRIWTGDIEIHITADVAYAVWQYWQVTGDDDFLRDYGAEIILDGAVFWGSRAEYDETDNRYHICDVIGPDEYHEHVDDNAYTNALARWHLERALDVLTWLHTNYPDKAQELVQRLNLNDTRLAHWRGVIERMTVLHDPATGLIEQCRGFFGLEDLDWAVLESRTQPIQEILGIERTNHVQALKQPDVLMLLFLLGDRFDEKTWRVNWDYYAPRTDHTYGSSLGPAVHAIMSCRLGMPEVAYEHFMRAALVDLDDVRGNTAEGVHGASAGGIWQAVVFGFAGLKLTPQGWETKPCLPSHWRRLTFPFLHRGTFQRVDLRAP